MRKGWIVLLTAVLVVAFAAPAMADLKVTGFYRAKAMLSNFFDGGGGPSLRTSEEEQTNSYVEQRAHLKFDVGTENVRAVFHFESDMNWGVAPATAARNAGGTISADAVQLETKNLYVWFKIPDTSIQAKVGMQSIPDHYAGIFSNNADIAGIVLNGTFEPVKWMLAWTRPYEGDYHQTDDSTVYIASAQFVPAKDMTLGVNFYYVQDDTGRDGTGAQLAPGAGLGGGPLNGYTADVYMPGVNFAMNAGIAKISAFAFYQFGTLEGYPGLPEVDVNAFAVDVRGDLKLGPGNFFIEGLFVSGGDGNDATEYESPITLGDYQVSATGGNAGFGRTHMYFLFGYDSQNVSQCLIGCSGGEYGDSFGNSGRGLWHVAAGYSQKFTDKLKGEINFGYLSAVDLYAEDEAIGRDKDMGMEGNVRLDYTIQKGLTFSLAGAVMKLGDFVRDDAVTEFEDTYYMGFARLNYSF